MICYDKRKCLHNLWRIIMKKTISMLLCAVMLFTLSLNVFAATGINKYEQKVLDKLSSVKIVTEKGWHFSFSQENINGARNYFLGDYDMNEDEMNVILSYIDQGMAKIEEEAKKAEFNAGDYGMSKVEDSKQPSGSGTNDGKFNLSMMGSDARNELLELGQKACDEADLTLSYNSKTGSVEITHVASNTPVFQSAAIIKQTGEEANGFENVLLISLLPVLATGLMFGISKKKGLFVK